MKAAKVAYGWCCLRCHAGQDWICRRHRKCLRCGAGKEWLEKMRLLVAERDPLLDPKALDQFRKGRKTRTVLGRGSYNGWPDAVWGEEEIKTSVPFICYTLAGWRRWTKGAKVLK